MSGCHVKRLLRLVLLVLMMVLVSAATAQQTARVLVENTPTTGTLDTNNVAQVYTFEGQEGQQISLTANSESGLGLALLLSDELGVPVAQGFTTAGPVTVADVVLPQTGTYYVTVLSAIGVTLPPNSAFTLLLETDAEATPPVTGIAATPVPEEADETEVVEEPAPVAPPRTFPPGEVLTATGLNIALTWNSTANLDLEVRDPVGGSLRFATPQVESGGVFGVNVNAACNALTAESPTEQASWPPGAIPTGSYELIVYYQPLADCPTTEPVTFGITVSLDGQVIDTIAGNLLPNETYLSSVVVAADGQVYEGLSGLYTDTAVLPLPAATFLANPAPIARNAVIEGIITSDDYYQTYSFQGQANELISITMNAVSGSLDTLLLLLDANGAIVDSNDDRELGDTDSEILNRRLLTDGTYTIIATRYGKDVGGTEGGYELLLTGPTGDLPQEVIDLGLPSGSVEISLLWNTNADLQLLVRDPRGDTVFSDVPEVPSGGRLAAAGNVNCTPSQTSPLSYVYWPQGIVVPGLYEVEVIYRNQCNDTRPVNFTLTIRVNGQTVYLDTTNPTPDEWYVTSFTIDVNRQVTAGPGGFIGTRERLNSLTIDYLPQIPNAIPIVAGQTVNGSITADNKFDLYVFEGQAGDVVTISMVRTAGNLDTTLFLVDSTGVQLAFNDDVVPGDNTDSLISEYTLPLDGRYIIIATHFGLEYGGSTGTYNLSFSRLNE